MGSLVQQREELERRVDDLRAFEREYRSRLKAYLEGQLRDLEAGVTESGTFPVVPPAPPAPPQLPAGLGQPALRNGAPPAPGQFSGPETVVQHAAGFPVGGASIHDRR
jgi:hypothetical protein